MNECTESGIYLIQCTHSQGGIPTTPRLASGSWLIIPEGVAAVPVWPGGTDITNPCTYLALTVRPIVKERTLSQGILLLPALPGVAPIRAGTTEDRGYCAGGGTAMLSGEVLLFRQSVFRIMTDWGYRRLPVLLQV